MLCHLLEALHHMIIAKYEKMGKEMVDDLMDYVKSEESREMC